MQIQVSKNIKSTCVRNNLRTILLFFFFSNIKEINTSKADRRVASYALVSFPERGRIIRAYSACLLVRPCTSKRPFDETIFIRHLLIRVGAYAMHTFAQYLRKVCRSECQRANITRDVFATPSNPFTGLLPL